MSTAQAARTIASEAMDRLERAIGRRIEEREAHPYKTYVFHREMATMHRKNRRLFLAWFHRQLRRRWWSKVTASREAKACEDLEKECLR